MCGHRVFWSSCTYRICEGGSTEGIDMADLSFDTATTALALTISRRQAVRAFAALTGAAVLSSIGIEEAVAADPGRCRKLGVICRRDSECCNNFCDPTSRRCACPPGSTECKQSGQCVSCPRGTVLNQRTCQCECAPGSQVCGDVASGLGTCCQSDESCCVNVANQGFCCPPGTSCCVNRFGSFLGCCGQGQTCDDFQGCI